jgi:hypothetical protein
MIYKDLYNSLYDLRGPVVCPACCVGRPPWLLDMIYVMIVCKQKNLFKYFLLCDEDILSIYKIILSDHDAMKWEFSIWLKLNMKNALLEYEYN